MKRSPKPEEIIAEKYLYHLGFSDVVYEPVANSTPDYLVNNSIAVEVRRLNQYWFRGENAQAVEEVEFNLIPRIRKLLEGFQEKDYSHSVLVSISFQRPLKMNNNELYKIKQLLTASLPLNQKEVTLNINDNLKITLYQSDVRFEKSIFIAAISDRNKGGFVIAETYKNLLYVVNEKDNKIRSHYNKYNVWWLVLVDYIGYALSYSEWPLYGDQLQVETLFDKIILISPLGNNKAIDIMVVKKNIPPI